MSYERKEKRKDKENNDWKKLLKKGKNKKLNDKNQLRKKTTNKQKGKWKKKGRMRIKI